MKPKINIITIECGDNQTTQVRIQKHFPVVEIERGGHWTYNEQGECLAYETDNRFHYHVTPASMVRCFLVLMSLQKRNEEKAS